MIWAGISFKVVGHRDGGLFRAPGLFAFVREDAIDGPVMLFAGHAEDIAQVAGPSHPVWAEALALGMDELHVHMPVPRRIDRQQLLARVIHRAQPSLNVLDEAPKIVGSKGRRASA